MSATNKGGKYLIVANGKVNEFNVQKQYKLKKPPSRFQRFNNRKHSPKGYDVV